jgi:uncharacterized protein YkwD
VRNATTALLLTLVLALATAPTALAAPAPSGPTRLEARVLRLVNAARRAHGLRPVRYVKRLRSAARAHSGDMLRRDYFAHDAPNEAWDHRVRRYMPRAHLVAETIAWGAGAFATPALLVRWWLKSPPHRAILLDSHLTLAGIGIRRGTFLGARNAIVVTADFARR